MVSVETVSIVFTGLSISLAAFYYISTIRNAQRTRELALKAQEQALETRQLQLYTTAFQHTLNREFMLAYVDVIYNQEWEDYEDFMRKYGPESNPEAYASVVQVIELFQMIGLFVEQNALDIEIVNRHCGKVVVRVWEKVEPFVREFRIWTDNPMHWHSFEYLYHEMKKIYQQED
jgi:hypothetical protein